MKKLLTFLFALTFLFLFSGSVFGEGLETWWYESGKKKSEVLFKNGKEEGVYKEWHESRRKKSRRHYKNGKENGIRKEWDDNGKLILEGKFIDGVEEIR
jgi:antitoxin component YwqK of YwqJK toxin-antitoxin module